MKINLDEKGLNAVFKPWQLAIIEYLSNNRIPLTSRQIHETIQPEHPVSRASVINFLNYLRDEGLIQYEVDSGRGGMHGVYKGSTTVRGVWSEIKARVLFWLSEGELVY